MSEFTTRRLNYLHKLEEEKYKALISRIENLIIIGSPMILVDMQQALEIFIKADRSNDNKNCPKTRQETYSKLMSTVQWRKQKIPGSYKQFIDKRNSQLRRQKIKACFSSLWSTIKYPFTSKAKEETNQIEFSSQDSSQKTNQSFFSKKIQNLHQIEDQSVGLLQNKPQNKQDDHQKKCQKLKN